MFDCFHYGGCSYEENLSAHLVRPTPTSGGNILVGYNTTPCFQLTDLRCAGELTLPPDGNFMGLYILAGSGKMVCEDSTVIPVQTGNQFFLSAGTAVTFQGEMRLAKLQGPMI